MQRRIRPYLAYTLIAFVGLLPNLASAASPLAMVPDSAPVVVHLHGAERAKERLVAMLKKALPEFTPVVESFLDNAIKEGAYSDGRKVAGVPKDGSIFAFLTELPKAGAHEPMAAFVATIEKYEDFRDGVLKEDERKALKADPAGYESVKLEDGETLYLVNKKTYVIATTTEKVAKDLAKKYTGLDEKMSKAQAAKFLASDLSVYFNLDDVNKTYVDEMKQAKESATEGIKTAIEAAEKSQRASLTAIEKLIGPLFQAIGDSKAGLIGLEFRPTGTALHIESELKSDSTTSKLFQGAKTSNFDGVAALPAGQMLYIGTLADKSIYQMLAGLIYGADGDDKAGKAALEQLAQAGPGLRLDAINIPPQAVQVWQYDEPAKAVDAQVKIFESLVSGGAYSSGVLKEKPSVKARAQKYGDIEFTSIKLAWDLKKMADGAGGGAPLPEEAKTQLADGLKKLLGETQTIWLGSNGKQFVQVTAADWATAEKLLDQQFKGEGSVGKVPAFAEVRKELPAEANMIVLVDVVRYVGVILEFTKPIIESVAPIPVKLPTLPAKLPATFVGKSVTLTPERASVDVFISAPTVHEIYKAYVLPLVGGARGAAN